MDDAGRRTTLPLQEVSMFVVCFWWQFKEGCDHRVLTEDAEKELLKLLQILNAMPQGTPSDAKKLSAKFAERLGR